LMGKSPIQKVVVITAEEKNRELPFRGDGWHALYTASRVKEEFRDLQYMDRSPRGDHYEGGTEDGGTLWVISSKVHRSAKSGERKLLGEVSNTDEVLFS